MIPHFIARLIWRNKGIATLVALYYLFTYLNRKLNEHKPAAVRSGRRSR